MSTINIEVTKNVYDVDLQQNVTTYDVTLEKGYYPLPGGGGGGGDTSNLVPYTGANKDVNIASNYFKTSKGFDFTFDEYNYFTSYYGVGSCILDFSSKDDGTFGSINVKVNPEDFNILKTNNVGLTSNYFTVTNEETFSLKPFISDSGFIKTGGTANQGLKANGGVFDLNTKADLVGGKVPASQLPSYVDDVLEFANLASFPATGESGKIYIAIDTNVTYRWSGTGYSEISASLALGETPSTAYRGDRGKIAYDHSQVTHDKTLVGLGNVDNTSDLDKPISTATQNALNTKADLEVVNNLQIGGRNYLLKSGNFKNTDSWGVYSSSTLSYENSTLKMVGDSTGIPRIRNLTYIKLDVPQDWTFSVEYNSTSFIPLLGGKFGLTDTSLEQGSFSMTLIEHKDLGGGNKRSIFKWSAPAYSSTTPSFFVYVYLSLNQTIYLKSIKGEKGNKATDWTPAPEDKQDRLQDVIGNIGVGKTDDSATEKLDVNGNVKATGFKTPNGSATQGLTANGGVFDLDTKADLDGGKVPAWQLPSYVDDVLEFANLASFPATGESGKIYIAIDTNLTYRWGGSSYIGISSSLALGETSSTAYRGDYGKVAYDHSQKTTGNPHSTKVEELTDVSGDATSIVDTDTILKKESGGLWKKITFANFKNWFTTELAKKINIGVDTFFNFKNISAMALSDFRSITPNIETIYFTEEQNATGWQQIRYNGLGISIPASTETLVTLTNENYIELDSDSTFNLIDVANTKINGIFEKDFVIIKFNARVVTPSTANQWFKVILKINGVQFAVSPVFYLTETSGTVEQIAHNFALNVPAEMVTNGATLHLKTSATMTFNNPAISVVRVHKSTNANL